LDASDFTAIAAAVIAACALVATIWQAFLTRAHNRLSVRPHLVRSIDRHVDGTGTEMTLRIKNCGIGPAIVRERGFCIDGKPFEPPEAESDEVSAIFKFALGSKYPWQLRRQGLPGIGTAIPPGGEHVIASVHFNQYSRAMADAAVESAGDIYFFLKYESLYGERYELPRD